MESGTDILNKDQGFPNELTPFLQYVTTKLSILNQSRLSNSTRENFIKISPIKPNNINYRTDGFIVQDNLYSISSVSLLITSFLEIFQHSGYLNVQDYDSDYSILEKLFLGRTLNVSTRIRWNDQYEDKRNTGRMTWVQLYYIFYQLHSNGILSFIGDYKDIKSHIGYRLINSFVSGDRPIIEKYDSIDRAIGDFHDLHTEKDEKKWVKLSEPKRPVNNRLESLTNLLIGLCSSAPSSSVKRRYG
jgi:hypothetical protein